MLALPVGFGGRGYTGLTRSACVCVCVPVAVHMHVCTCVYTRKHTHEYVRISVLLVC